VVAILVAVLVSLGLWQLRRHDDRRAVNARIVAGSRATAALDTVVSPAAERLPEAARFARVEVRGTWDRTHEVLIRFRTRDGLPGYESLTPLVVRPGVAVLVDRGWLPLEVAEKQESPPPAGEATVVGLMLAGESEARFRPSEGTFERLVVGAVHVPALESRLGYDLYPGFVQLVEPDDPTTFPVPLPKPRLDQGPHLTYAMQWFAFAVIALVGWGLLVRRSASVRTVQ
jgi:cytochrome oxidase assembly protein ShyY1